MATDHQSHFPEIMSTEEFKEMGYFLINSIVDYRKNVNSHIVLDPFLQPGFLAPMLPTQAPQKPEKFIDVMEDLTNKIMKGVVHWNHRRFHAYFPAGNSYPSLIGDMLCDMLNMIGFSWPSGPSCTELEIIVLDWFAKALGLPQKFLSTTTGGGVILNSAEDCILTVMMSARNQAIESLKVEFDADDDNKIDKILHKLVVYTGRESEKVVEKAARLCLLKFRVVDTREEGYVSAESLEEAMAADEKKGLKPFFFSAILGSRLRGDFDDLLQLIPVIERRPSYFWFHVDGDYAGNSFILYEMRYLGRGLEYANSFSVNPHKWLLVHCDCSVLWVNDRAKYTSGFVVNPVYLQHEDNQIIDYRHWQISLSRRFRALKLYFVFRMYGLENLRKYIRNHLRLATYFRNLFLADPRFQIYNEVTVGLVCFRLVSGVNHNNDTKNLYYQINRAAKICVTLCEHIYLKKSTFFIRFCVNYEHATKEDMEFAFNEIKKQADDVLDPDFPAGLGLGSDSK